MTHVRQAIWEVTGPMSTEPVDAAAAVDAQNAPTAACKTRRTRFAQRPQGISLNRGHF